MSKRHSIFAACFALGLWACSSEPQGPSGAEEQGDSGVSAAADTSSGSGWATLDGLNGGWGTSDGVNDPAVDGTSGPRVIEPGDSDEGPSPVGDVESAEDTLASATDALLSDAEIGQDVTWPTNDVVASDDVSTQPDGEPTTDAELLIEDSAEAEDSGGEGGAEDADADETKPPAPPDTGGDSEQGPEGEELSPSADAAGGPDDASEDTTVPEPCSPSCEGKVCGDDGCGGSCGSCSGHTLCVEFGGACQAPEGEGAYRVGVDYHSTTEDFAQSAFLSRYHEAGVRDEVLSQLQGMADAGATIISTRLWLVSSPDEPLIDAYRWHFPPTEQELLNLRQYTEDVSQVVSAMGHRLQLDLSMLYLWCADYRVGSPETTLGQCGLDLAAYDAALTQTVNGVIDAVRGIYRPDGQHAVAILYLDGEVMTAVADDDPATQWEKANQRWFLKNYYANFSAAARAAGMLPSLYFLTGLKEDIALNNTYQEAYLPELAGHRSVYWIYRTLRFMEEAGLELPSRVDFSLYPNPPFEVSNDATIVNRVFDDLEATAGELYPGGLRYGLAETIYYAEPNLRERLGKALAAERELRGGNPEFVTFWSTPYNNGQTAGSMAPFEMDAFFGDDLSYPFGQLNPSFEVQDPVTGLPVDWTLSWQNGGATGSGASVVSVADAPDGDKVLRLEAGNCPTCSGDYDGRWLRGDSVEVTPGQMAVVRVYAKSTAPASGVAGSVDYTGGLMTLLGYTDGGVEHVLGQVGVPDSAGSFRRVVLVGRIPPEVSTVALRFGLVKAWGHSIELDWVH